MITEMDMKKVIFKFVSISFSILITLLVVLGLFKTGTYCYDFGYRLFTEEPMEAAPGTDVVVQISEDMSGYEIGKLLEEKGLVEDGLLFYAQLKLSAYAKDLNPGTYTLNTSMDANEMMAVMSAVAEDTESTETESGE